MNRIRMEAQAHKWGLGKGWSRCAGGHQHQWAKHRSAHCLSIYSGSNFYIHVTRSTTAHYPMTLLWCPYKKLYWIWMDYLATVLRNIEILKHWSIEILRYWLWCNEILKHWTWNIEILNLNGLTIVLRNKLGVDCTGRQICSDYKNLELKICSGYMHPALLWPYYEV